MSSDFGTKGTDLIEVLQWHLFGTERSHENVVQMEDILAEIQTENL
jgi:hypothetical protein